MRLVALAAACAALVTPARALAACKCAEQPAPVVYKNAQVLFEGKVSGSTTPEREPNTVRYSFEVTRSWKGAAKGDKVTVITDKAGDCAMKLSQGASFLVAGTDEGLGYPSLKPCHPFHRPSSAKDAEKLRKSFEQLSAPPLNAREQRGPDSELATAQGDQVGDEDLAAERKKAPPPPKKKKKKR